MAPRNTHDWAMFITIDEMKKLLIEEGEEGRKEGRNVCSMSVHCLFNVCSFI